jgi:type I restriction enzyme S subunit
MLHQDNAWREVSLGEVVEIFDHKRIPLSTKQRSQRRGPYPYYGASGVIDYVDDYIFEGRYLLISEDGENLNSRQTPIAFFATGKFWVNNHAHIVRAIPDIADDYYLMSWIGNADISGYITGTAQPKLSQANLKTMRLRLPPLPTQRKIAAILSAYDDLIENNTQRIRILESGAIALPRVVRPLSLSGA